MAQKNLKHLAEKSNDTNQIESAQFNCLYFYVIRLAQDLKKSPEQLYLQTIEEPAMPAKWPKREHQQTARASKGLSMANQRNHRVLRQSKRLEPQTKRVRAQLLIHPQNRIPNGVLTMHFTRVLPLEARANNPSLCLDERTTPKRLRMLNLSEITLNS